jgi:hypothetical protein
VEVNAKRTEPLQICNELLFYAEAGGPFWRKPVGLQWAPIYRWRAVANVQRLTFFIKLSPYLLAGPHTASGGTCGIVEFDA